MHCAEILMEMETDDQTANGHAQVEALIEALLDWSPPRQT